MLKLHCGCSHHLSLQGAEAGLLMLPDKAPNCAIKLQTTLVTAQHARLVLHLLTGFSLCRTLRRCGSMTSKNNRVRSLSGSAICYMQLICDILATSIELQPRYFLLHSCLSGTFCTGALDGHDHLKVMHGTTSGSTQPKVAFRTDQTIYLQTDYTMAREAEAL